MPKAIETIMNHMRVKNDAITEVFPLEACNSTQLRRNKREELHLLSWVVIYFMCSKYSLIPYLPWFLHLSLVSDPTNGIFWVLPMKSKLLYICTYDACILPMREDSFFTKVSGAPLYWIVHSSKAKMAACKFLMVLRNYFLCSSKPCKREISLCTFMSSS